jgi:hypothetical protein
LKLIEVTEERIVSIFTVQEQAKQEIGMKKVASRTYANQEMSALRTNTDTFTAITFTFSIRVLVKANFRVL